MELKQQLPTKWKPFKEKHVIAHSVYKNGWFLSLADFLAIKSDYSETGTKNNKMKNHYILKTYCQRLFLIGSGNFWHEENEIGDDQKLLYRLYTAMLIFLYSVLTILEIMAATMGDFPSNEKSDSMNLALAHTVTMIKIFFIVTKKSYIKSLSLRMVTVCESYEESTLMEEAYKIMKINVVVYLGIVFGSTLSYISEGLGKMFTGSYYVAVVTYYPSYENESVLATLFRVFTTIVLIFMMITMIIGVDSFITIYLIMYKYKFITLKQYFDNLNKEFLALSEQGNEEMATEKLANGLVEGIKMHSSLISLSSDFDKAFGTVMAIHVCESSVSAVFLLLQLVLTEGMTIIARAKLILFVIALFFLLGLFLCNAGEITYRASQVADAIFYCGWQCCPSRPKSAPYRNIRQLVLLAIMQAQQPLVMKAFKMLELTYETYLQVVRGTYSVFALISAQNRN